jgi:hypothetical protein
MGDDQRPARGRDVDGLARLRNQPGDERAGDRLHGKARVAAAAPSRRPSDATQIAGPSLAAGRPAAAGAAAIAAWGIANAACPTTSPSATERAAASGLDAARPLGNTNTTRQYRAVPQRRGLQRNE